MLSMYEVVVYVAVVFVLVHNSVHNPSQLSAAAAQLFNALRQLIQRLYGTHGTATITPNLSGMLILSV